MRQRHYEYDASGRWGNTMRWLGAALRLTKKIFLKQLFAVSLSSGLLACAGHGEPAANGVSEASQDVTDCISVASVRDYRILDDASLIVSAHHQRHYQILLARPARSLRHADRLSFVGRGGRICSGSGELIIRNGVVVESVRVDSVFRVSEAGLASLMEPRSGKAQAVRQTTAPAPDPIGAEVEELD